jgi:hypothetical protein
MLPECVTINTLRLDRDWSWKTLAHMISQANDVPIAWRTVHYLLTQPDTPTRARDRTLHKLKKFVVWAKTEGLLPSDTGPSRPTGDPDAAPVLRSHDRPPDPRPRRAARLRS